MRNVNNARMHSAAMAEALLITLVLCALVLGAIGGVSVARVVGWGFAP